MSSAISGKSLDAPREVVYGRPMNVLSLDHKSDSGDARKALDRAATAAARRILQETGRTVTQLAGAMCYTSRSLDEFLSGRIHWGAQSIAALAAATDQHPVEMLAREAMPDALGEIYRRLNDGSPLASPQGKSALRDLAAWLERRRPRRGDGAVAEKD